ncbi:MAG: hypothetical protein WC755_03025 [Candidatus Woesearchaeota archaeon]|jgi:hypothetical protein
MKKIIKNLTLAAVIAAAALTTGCGTSAMQKEVVVRKSAGGSLEFKDGPFYDMTYGWFATVNSEWDGRFIVDLPLKGTDYQFNTLNGVLEMDGNVYFQFLKDKNSRMKRFAMNEDVESQIGKTIDGVVRSTAKMYTCGEILNEEEAKANGKLPFYQIVVANLYIDPIFEEKFGIDKTKFAYWPGNIGYPVQSANEDLIRQEQIIINQGKKEAQNYELKADSVRALADMQFSNFLKGLSPAQQRYLQTRELMKSARTVGKDPNLKVDYELFIE